MFTLYVFHPVDGWVEVLADRDLEFLKLVASKCSGPTEIMGW